MARKQKELSLWAEALYTSGAWWDKETWALGPLGFLLPTVTADTVHFTVWLETISEHPNGRTEAKAEDPILWPPDAKSWLIGKDPDAGKDCGQEEKGTTEDEMVGWHHRLDAHGFGWTPGVGDGLRGLVCCSSWGSKESDTTERSKLSWTELNECLDPV